MGAFYRSRHELIFAFKVGAAPHVNAFGLGEQGMDRGQVGPPEGEPRLHDAQHEACLAIAGCDGHPEDLVDVVPGQHGRLLVGQLDQSTDDPGRLADVELGTPPGSGLEVGQLAMEQA